MAGVLKRQLVVAAGPVAAWLQPAVCVTTSASLHAAQDACNRGSALCTSIVHCNSASFPCRQVFLRPLVLLLLLLPLLLQSGEPISFYWQFAGIGQERCFHDDVEIPDCASGVIVQVRRMKHHESIQMIASNAVMGTAANQTCEGALEHVVLQGRVCNHTVNVSDKTATCLPCSADASPKRSAALVAPLRQHMLDAQRYKLCPLLLCLQSNPFPPALCCPAG
jgi:hypothetical protein